MLSTNIEPMTSLNNDGSILLVVQRMSAIASQHDVQPLVAVSNANGGQPGIPCVSRFDVTG